MMNFHTDVTRQDDAPTVKFSKTDWKKAGNQYSTNPLNTRTYGALSQFADMMGRLGRGDHVPCVWRRSKDLQRVLGIGRDAFRSRISELIAAGFLIECSLHGTAGKRKMFIAKMPTQSETDALLAAVEAFRRYRKIPADVRNALFWEIEHRGLWDIWSESAPKDEAEPKDELGEKDDVENLFSTADKPTLKAGKSAFETSYIEKRNQEPNQESKLPSPFVQKLGLDFAFDSKTLIAFLRAFAERIRIGWDEQTIGAIALVYERKYHDSFALRTFLAQKLFRLNGDYKPKTIASFVLADVDEFFHTGSSTLVQPRRQTKADESYNEVSTTKTKVESRTVAEKEWNSLMTANVRTVVSTTTYDSWFSHLKGLRKDRNVWTVEAADSFFVDWITQNYLPMLEKSTGYKIKLIARSKQTVE